MLKYILIMLMSINYVSCGRPPGGDEQQIGANYCNAVDSDPQIKEFFDSKEARKIAVFNAVTVSLLGELSIYLHIEVEKELDTYDILVKRCRVIKKNLNIRNKVILAVYIKRDNTKDYIYKEEL